MKIRKFVNLFFAFSLMNLPAGLTGADEKPDVVAEAMRFNRAAGADFSIDVSTELPLTIPLVEYSLTNPLEARGKIAESAHAVRAAGTSAGIIEECANLLGVSTQSAAALTAGTSAQWGQANAASVEQDSHQNRWLSLAIANALRRGEEIYKAIERAQALLSKSVNSITPQQRDWIYRIIREELDPGYKPPIDYGILKKNGEEISYTRWKAEVYKSVQGFDVESICLAARILASACDKSLPALQQLSRETGTGPKTKSKDGKILISGADDDVYTAGEIKDAALIIDLGGNNTYYCGVGAAGENEIKILIDLGENITIETSSPAAGSGIFGIGIAYFPNPNGTKTIKSGNFSQGCGIFGAGALFINGKAEMRCGYFGQGAGCFGTGVVAHRDAGMSIYRAKYFSQGAAYTKGVGLFYVNGDSISVEGGFDVADSREAQGYTSLCQGVGFGPRAFAGGGLGIAIIDSDNSEFNSSYFAHGAGYWHAAGVFQLFGSGNKVQSRRYCQGAGVHSAFGMMSVSGEKNRTVVWGVGPAYGWDRSIGIFTSTGNGGIFQTEWGSGQGNNGGRSIFTASGDDLTVWLPGLGSGSYVRDMAGYGVAVINGKNTIIKDEENRFFMKDAGMRGALVSKFDSWGVLIAQDAHRVKTLELPKVTWPSPERKTPGNESREESVTSLFRLYEIYLRRWDVENLLSAPPEHAALFIKLYQPYSVEEQLALRTVIASYGGDAFAQLKKEIDAAAPGGKPSLVYLLSLQPAEKSAPELLSTLKDSNWRMRATALRALAYLYNKDGGSEPGRYTMLSEILKILKFAPKPLPELKEKLSKMIVNKQLADMFAVLALAGNTPVEKKLELFKLAPNIFENVTPEFKERFGEYIIANRGAYVEALKKELKALEEFMPDVEKAAKGLLDDGDWRVRQQAIGALGEMQSAGSAPLIKKFIYDKNTAIRESAVYALSRLGRDARVLLEREYRTANDETRALIATTAFHARDREMLKLIELGLKDKSEFVRLTAASAALNLKPEFEKERKKYIKQIEKSADFKNGK